MAKPIAIAADHGGFEYKQRIVDLLRERNYEVLDFGVTSDAPADYPDVARAAAEAVSRDEAYRGILVCGSGIGMEIVANKSAGVRAANCTSVEMARLAREHNDANMLAIGQRLVDWSTAEQMVEAFLLTDSSSEDRHRRRVSKIHDLTGR